jgi:hypothetical protein
VRRITLDTLTDFLLCALSFTFGATLLLVVLGVMFVIRKVWGF